MRYERIIRPLVWVALSLAAIYFAIPKESLFVNFLNHAEYKPLYGTTVKLNVCYRPGQQAKIKPAFEAVWEKMESIQEEMNVLDDQSELAKINRSYPDSIEITPDMYRILREAAYFFQVTQGAFDVTVWPLIELWKKAAKEDRYPTDAEISAAKAMLGTKKIGLLTTGRVQMANPKVRIDLGGIGAGFAADEAGRIFREYGFKNFLIDAGGDMLAGGLNCEGKKWRIGIKDPRDTRRLIDIVEISDMAVSTSGNYNQFYEIQGEKWSHIINPITGYPQRGVVSATLIAPRGIDVDAVATALCVWDPQAATEFVDRMGGGWASVIFSGQTDDELIRTESKNYSKFKSKLTGEF